MQWGGISASTGAKLSMRLDIKEVRGNWTILSLLSPYRTGDLLTSDKPQLQSGLRGGTSHIRNRKF